VVAVHGGPGVPVAAPWPGLGTLAGRYDFVFYDQRGCGRSTRPLAAVPPGRFWQRARALDAALGVGVQLADLERVRRLLGHERVVLVGEGAGATLAALWAGELPERVAGLVLLMPVDLVRVPADAPRRLFTWASDEVLRGMPAPLRDLERAMDTGDSALSRELAAAVRAGDVVPGGLAALAAWLTFARPHDDQRALARVTAPVLVIGAADGEAGEAARRMAGYLRGARLVTLADPGAAQRDAGGLEPLLGPWLDALARW